jgi:hypothetical protein
LATQTKRKDMYDDDYNHMQSIDGTINLGRLQKKSF